MESDASRMLCPYLCGEPGGPAGRLSSPDAFPMRNCWTSVGLCSWLAMGLLGCASTRETPPAGGACVRFIDLQRSTELALASRSMEPYKTQLEKGKLPRGLKLVDDEQMATLLATLREHRFYRHAIEASPGDPELRSKTRQLLVLETAGRVLVFPFAPHPGRDPVLRAQAQDFVDIKRSITELFQRTTQFAGVR